MIMGNVEILIESFKVYINTAKENDVIVVDDSRVICGDFILSKNCLSYKQLEMDLTNMFGYTDYDKLKMVVNDRLNSFKEEKHKELFIELKNIIHGKVIEYRN